MAVNQKAVKVLNKILEAGFTDEKAIAAMTMDDILSMQGITVADISLIPRCGMWAASPRPKPRKVLTSL